MCCSVYPLDTTTHDSPTHTGWLVASTSRGHEQCTPGSWLLSSLLHGQRISNNTSLRSLLRLTCLVLFLIRIRVCVRVRGRVHIHAQSPNGPHSLQRTCATQPHQQPHPFVNNTPTEAHQILGNLDVDRLTHLTSPRWRTNCAPECPAHPCTR
jgi:hypothetical protein